MDPTDREVLEAAYAFAEPRAHPNKDDGLRPAFCLALARLEALLRPSRAFAVYHCIRRQRGENENE